MKDICVVFCCNSNYLHKFKSTYHQLINNGKYNGDVCLIVGDDLKNIGNNDFIKKNNIIIKYFKDLPILSNEQFLKQQQLLIRPGTHWFLKRFQYHKFYLFDVFFKNWNYIFYIDCGMTIYSDIYPILNEKLPNILLANRDGVDNENAGWCKPITPGFGLKLGDQFTKTEPLYKELEKNYTIDESYFQTTLMLFDTSIIENDTFNNLYTLLQKYPISITNDQGIIALYFTQIKPCWKQLKRKCNELYYYDYVRCVNSKYIMVKNTSNNWLNIGYNE